MEKNIHKNATHGRRGDGMSDLREEIFSGDFPAYRKKEIEVAASFVSIAVIEREGNEYVRGAMEMFRKILNIPKRENDDYVCVASTNSIRGLYDFFEAKASQTTADPMYRGEVGRYYGCRFVEETNFLGNADGSNGLYGEAIFFGADAVREGIAIPEEIRIGIPTDFGRDQAIAWYALLGFQQTWDFSTDGETRIIVVDSL
jgi:hypothetical protein